MFYAVLLALAVVLFDQVSKLYIEAYMSVGSSVPVVNNVFHITLVLNPGAAFGILEHQQWFFIVVALLLFAAVAFFYRRLALLSQTLRLGVALFVGGALGNLIDRIRLGCVVDFFDFRIWPVFNVADTAIVLGVGLIGWGMLQLSEAKKDEVR